MDRDTSDFKRLDKKFMDDWVKDGEADNVKVEHILKVHPSKENALAFYAYTGKMNRESRSVRRQLYHGTPATCNLLQELNICSQSTCPMCSIVRESFNRDFIGVNLQGRKWNRLDKGFYLAPNSSKSHYYAAPGVSEI